MNRNLLAIAAAALLAVSGIIRADGEMKKPATTKPTSHATIRIIKPWSEITTLSDEQRMKIDEIHKLVNKQTKAIDDKEKDDIAALLNDEQKTQLAEVEAKGKEREKSMHAEKAHHSTTAPAAAPSAPAPGAPAPAPDNQ